MTAHDLKERLIAEGIISVQQEKRAAFRRGGVVGFERCRELHAPEDFQRVIAERMRWELTQGHDVPIEVFWEHRYATTQIEYVFEVLKVAWGWPVLSARAVMRYAAIVGAGGAA